MQAGTGAGSVTSPTVGSALVRTRGGVEMSTGDANVFLHDLDLSGFKSVEFEYEQVHILGGRIKNAMPVNTRRGSNNEGFALMAFTEPWLGFATVGSSRPGRSAFGPSNLLDQLAVHLERACNGETPVLATETEEGDENYDPMEEVEADGKDSSSSTVLRGSGEKRTRY